MPRGPAQMLLAFFLKGILVGLVIAVPVGPVGIMCVRRTIFEGKLVGLVSGFGAATADAVFGIIAGFGVTAVADLLLGYQWWLRGIGGCALLLIGGNSLRAKPQVQLDSPPDPESLSWDFLSTFLLTLANPVTIFAFAGIFAAIGLSGADATFDRAALLVLGVWAGSLLWWFGLSFGLVSFARSLEASHLAWVNRASGGILVLSGAALLASLVIERIR
ncbi:MAG: LysE family transporter [Alphaproteobacteria bacterium]|nr:LysE family transporter [Alphaproteobacteria bacterium]